MFKPCNMFSNSLTHYSNKWPNCSFSKEDSLEDLEVKEEDSVVEEDKFMN